MDGGDIFKNHGDEAIENNVENPVLRSKVRDRLEFEQWPLDNSIGPAKTPEDFERNDEGGIFYDQRVAAQYQKMTAFINKYPKLRKIWSLLPHDKRASLDHICANEDLEKAGKTKEEVEGDPREAGEELQEMERPAFPPSEDPEKQKQHEIEKRMRKRVLMTLKTVEEEKKVWEIITGKPGTYPDDLEVDRDPDDYVLPPQTQSRNVPSLPQQISPRQRGMSWQTYAHHIGQFLIDHFQTETEVEAFIGVASDELVWQMLEKLLKLSPIMGDGIEVADTLAVKLLNRVMPGPIWTMQNLYAFYSVTTEQLKARVNPLAQSAAWSGT